MRFRELMKSKSQTQVLLAKQLGVTQSLISQWMNGKCQPQVDMIPDIAKVLNCTVEEVVNCFKKAN